MRRIIGEAGMAGESGSADEQVAFVMRIWLEESNGASFWRGRVKEIESSRVIHFQDGSGLLRFVNARLVARNGIALAHGPAGGQSQ